MYPGLLGKEPGQWPKRVFIADDSGGCNGDAFTLAALLSAEAAEIRLPWMGDIRAVRAHRAQIWHVERRCPDCDDRHVCSEYNCGYSHVCITYQECAGEARSGIGTE